jgi:pyruvate formate lyase activating enzyme
VRGEGGTTRCRTRICRGGKLYTLTYGRPCLAREDPLAKNPLYHVEPGASAVGVATAGCNLSCSYCQNWEISQSGPGETKNMDLSPAALVSKAVERGLKWLTFSYTEPVAYLEYMVDAAREAKKAGVKVAVATAGYVCAKPLAEMIRCADAFSVTYKGHSEQFYRDVCGCTMQPVRDTLSALAKSGVWMEVAILVVPGLNDREDALRPMARYVAGLGRDIPVHFLRFSPAYRLQNLPPTPVRALEDARAIAIAEGIRFAYVDLPGHPAANTLCPGCGKAVIERAGFKVIHNRVAGGRCSACGARIAGRFGG